MMLMEVLFFVREVVIKVGRVVHSKGCESLEKTVSKIYLSQRPNVEYAMVFFVVTHPHSHISEKNLCVSMEKGVQPELHFNRKIPYVPPVPRRSCQGSDLFKYHSAPSNPRKDNDVRLQSKK